MEEELRCVHRHTITEHPGCFAKGDVKYPNEKEYIKNTGKPWYSYPDYLVGYLDIESDGLKADFSTMLTWCIKEKGGLAIVDYITKDELFFGDADRRLVESLVGELKRFKIIVSFFGSRFDLPYIRTKALHYGIDFPHFNELYHHDLYFIAKSKLCLSRKSLDNICDYFGIEGKTPLDKEVWRKAKYGDPDAIQQVLVHNIGDVKITEELHNKLEPFAKWNRNSI